MQFIEKLRQAQKDLNKNQIDGWLIVDFRRNNELACSFLEIPKERLLTRRFCYWIPKQGEPVKIIASLEAHTLDHLPGQQHTYRTWQEFEEWISKILKGSSKVAMEYSPRAAIPSISKIDAGTMELVRDCKVDVVPSAALLQTITVLSQKQLDSHLAAAEILDTTAANTWKWIAKSLSQNETITEYDVQQFILKEFTQAHCISEGTPICAVNENSANPHYSPEKTTAKTIQKGDFILIDLWCKQDHPDAIYADITRVAVAGTQATEKQEKIFSIVKNAQRSATEFVRHRFQENKPIMGFEVDRVCREVIEKSGYGSYFIHRTGHSIDTKDHGSGTNLDDFETHDTRQLLPGTCFSIEPGIYLPSEFGIRLEYDIYVHPNNQIQITGGIQNSIEYLIATA